MKIDKRNPRHWLLLFAFGFSVVCAMLLRPLLHRRRSGRVLLYGHKLSGNLLALHAHAQANPQPGLELAFLTMDAAYHRALLRSGVASVLGVSPSSIRWLATADALVSDHGLHAMEAMLGRTDLKFLDAWHGIPFKGFDADDFRVQRRYDETWVASPLLASMYVERFGFEARRVKVTGYARTDRLVAADERAVGEARRRLGLDGQGPIVLFAPTWKQDDANRDLFPFHVDANTFCGELSALVARHGATAAFRTHLNSGTEAAQAAAFPNIIALPATSYPDTEEILLASDILVCDWSSIAFDFLLLDRPTIFLDVEPPFAKGLSLDAGHRFGAIARDMEAMLTFIDRYLDDPLRYREDCGVKSAIVRHAVYGGFDDGRSSERCFQRLAGAVATAGSSR